MRFLKYLIGFLVAILLVYLVLCFIGPKSMDYSTGDSIQAPPATVYNLVNNLETWPAWSPWIVQDTAMLLTYGDKKVGEGASYGWQSATMGNGSLKITKSVSNASTENRMEFEGMGGANSTFTISPEEKGSKLTWAMVNDADVPFLFRGMMMVMGYKGKLKNDFKNGVANLKKLAETRASGEYNGFKIKEVDMKERHYVMRRQEIDMANVQQYYARNLGQLYGGVMAAKVEMDGMPSGLFYKWDEVNGKVDMAAAIPTKDALELDGASNLTMPAGKSIQVDYVGDYEGTAAAHYAIDDYMKDRGLLPNSPVIEEYVTDPELEKDPSKWLTKIIYYYN